MADHFDESNMEDWVSNPKGMMKTYQGLNYTLGQSLADLIDNCFDGCANNIDIRIGYSDDADNESLFIRVLDDGEGMTEDQLAEAMQLGVERERSDDALGVFGVGMKLSSLAQANQVTVVSWKSGIPSTRRIDAKYIREFNENKIFKSGTESPSYKMSKNDMINGNWSTMVLLEEIHNRSWRNWTVADEVALEKEIKKINIHLRLTYHLILNKYPDKTLKFQGKKVEPLDPSMIWETDTKYGTVMESDRISVKIDGNTLSAKITFVIIPHTLQFIKDKKRCSAVSTGYKLSNDMAGLYLYRNDRLIEYGGWQKLISDSDPNKYKCGKIIIDIPPKYYEYFGMNPTKTEMTLPDDFMRKLHLKISEKRRWGSIKSGKKISFREAIDYRYRNEGKKAINRDKKKAMQKKQGKDLDKTNPSSNSGATVPAAPGSGPATRSKPIKPKPVISTIDESDSNWTFVKLDKAKEGYEKLIEMLRMWTE